MENAQLRIRLPADVRGYLAYRAQANGRSLNAEVQGVIRETMARDPVHATVIKFTAAGVTSYVATYGDGGEQFAETNDKQSAVNAARAKLKELGFPRGRVEYCEENLDA